MNPEGTTFMLPMAGKGSRFKKEGYNVPKPFLDIDGSPMFLKSIEGFPKSDRYIFICLRDHLLDYDMEKKISNVYSNFQILSVEETTGGQACTCEIGLLQAGVDLEKPLFLTACDKGEIYDSQEYSKLLLDESVDVIVWTFRNNRTLDSIPNSYSWILSDQENNINKVYCKEFIFDDTKKYHAITGTMFFRKAKYFLDGLHKNYSSGIKTNGEFYVDDIINRNIESKLRVKLFETIKYVGWGTPEDYENYYKEKDDNSTQ